MSKKMIIVLALVVLAVCLISGGCQNASQNSTEIMSWQDMIKLAPRLDSNQSEKQIKVQVKKEAEKNQPVEKKEIKLYFAADDGQGLVVETRSIDKTEGIARSTIQELIKGPLKGAGEVFPPDTRLLDINIKPEGLCIVDFNSQAIKLESEQAERIMVYSLAATLSQFPSIKEVSFRINGEDVTSLRGAVDLSSPVTARPRTRI
ncbi:MAG: GerMN domain-containing protein [Syntrophomonadaceae bacterium]|nr:GerMN domain-containing protein [Syntrophomonadaceae bacterium]